MVIDAIRKAKKKRFVSVFFKSFCLTSGVKNNKGVRKIVSKLKSNSTETIFFEDFKVPSLE